MYVYTPSALVINPCALSLCENPSLHVILPLPRTEKNVLRQFNLSRFFLGLPMKNLG
jgi:hypothetical protein